MMKFQYTISEAKKEIKNSISVYMMKDEKGNYIIPENKKNPFYIIGVPGIGKTEMAEQIAKELGIGFLSTSLTHHTRNSVLGLPVITDVYGEKGTEYTIPDMLAKVIKECEKGYKEGILLIDEFASMSDALVAPMLAFLQNKCIGNHKLPEGWVLLLCSNPPEYNETAREFDAAVMDRVRLMNVIYSKEDFINYAIEINMHPIIIDYIRNNENSAYICESDNLGNRIVTTRGWENLSQCLYGYEKLNLEVTPKLIYQFIKDENVVYEFYNYYVLCKSTLKIEDITDIIQGVNWSENIEKVYDMDFNRKMQISDVLMKIAVNDSEKVVQDAKLLAYLKRWIDEWEDNYTDIDCFEGAMKSRIGQPIFAVSYLPKVFSERKCDKAEEQMINEILLSVKKSKKDSFQRATDGMVLKAMKMWYEKKNTKVMEYMNNINNEISNIIKFIKNIDDTSFMKFFIRNLNQQENVLYILTELKNEEYTAQLSLLYGNEFDKIIF